MRIERVLSFEFFFWMHCTWCNTIIVFENFCYYNKRPRLLRLSHVCAKNLFLCIFLIRHHQTLHIIVKLSRKKFCWWVSRASAEWMKKNDKINLFKNFSHQRSRNLRRWSCCVVSLCCEFVGKWVERWDDGVRAVCKGGQCKIQLEDGNNEFFNCSIEFRGFSCFVSSSSHWFASEFQLIRRRDEIQFWRWKDFRMLMSRLAKIRKKIAHTITKRNRWKIFQMLRFLSKIYVMMMKIADRLFSFYTRRPAYISNLFPFTASSFFVCTLK